MKIELEVAQALINQKKTLAIAESCSGGLLSHRLTNIPGSSAYFIAGIVTYSNLAKKKLVKISPFLIKKFGAVSYQTASQMAKNVRHLFKTDFGMSITGIAGPTGGTISKPVGVTFIAVSTDEETLCLGCRFKGSRAAIKNAAATQALDLLYDFLT